MVTVLEAVVDRRRDDLGLVAVDAAGGELLGDRERVEHAGSLPRGRHRRNRPRRRVDSGRLRGEAAAAVESVFGADPHERWPGLVNRPGHY